MLVVKISLNFLMVASPNPGKRLTFHISPFENISHTTSFIQTTFSTMFLLLLAQFSQIISVKQLSLLNLNVHS